MEGLSGRKIFKFSARVLSWIKIIAAIFAVATIIYTGLLLGVIEAIPFWNTPMLVVLFLVSALSTGISAVVLIVGLQNLFARKSEATRSISEGVHGLSRIELPLIVTELLVLFLLLFIMIAGSRTAAASARHLVSGAYAVVFWLGLVVVGLLVPFTLEALSITRSAKITGKNLSVLAVISAICVLVGGLVLRYSVLAAGISVSGTL